MTQIDVNGNTVRKLKRLPSVEKCTGTYRTSRATDDWDRIKETTKPDEVSEA